MSASADTPEADPDADDEDDVQDVYAWVLEAVEERTSEDSPWSSEGELRQAQHSTDYGRDAVETAIDQAVANDDLLDWHGLLAPATPDAIQHEIAAENQAEITRKILVRKAARLKGRIEE